MNSKILWILGIIIIIIAVIALLSANSDESSSSNINSGSSPSNLPPGSSLTTDPFLPVSGGPNTPTTFYGRPVTKNSTNYKYTGADGVDYILPIMTPAQIATHPDAYGRVRLTQWLMFSQSQIGNPFPGAAIIMSPQIQSNFKSVLGYPAYGAPNLKGLKTSFNSNTIPENSVYVKNSNGPQMGMIPYVLNSSLALVNTRYQQWGVDYPVSFAAGPVQW